MVSKAQVKKNAKTEQKMLLLGQLPHGVVKFFATAGPKFELEFLSDKFCPTDPWFGASFWDDGCEFDSFKNEKEVIAAIEDKITQTGNVGGYDFFICDSLGQHYEWKTIINLTKVR